MVTPECGLGVADDTILADLGKVFCLLGLKQKVL
jgi:hypothetical protein